MGELARLYFLGFYAVALVILVLRVLPAAAHVPASGDRARGFARHLPTALLPVGFVVPPLALLLRVGELSHEWVPVRVTGLALGLYAAAMLPWAAAMLGRQLVPQAVVLADHELVTAGPFRFVRHPTYSGDLALWLGAALATLNVALLVLWPVYALGVAAEARIEEGLLEARFGEVYARYRQRTGAFVPMRA